MKIEIKNQYEKLCKEIKQHNYNYYNLNKPTLSDEQYDHLIDQLFQLEKEYPDLITSSSPSQQVGYTVVSKLEKTQHEFPLLSLQKTKSIDDLKEFMGDKICLLMLKADGLTVELDYENGELVEASTRGDGITGEIITYNAKTFKNIPLRIDYKGKLKVAGEAVILYSDFKNINESLSEEEKYANPRNLVAGSVRQLDSKICAKRNVNFYVFSLLKGSNHNSKSRQLEWLRDELGFDIIPFITTNFNKINEDISGLKNFAVSAGIPFDGEVLSYDDIEYGNMLGVTSHHPRSAIAYKFEDERVKTKYIKTLWNTTRTGKINPTGLFEPVEIEGTIVEKASLFNLDIFENLKLGKGDIISTFKANCIIPQIDENFTQSDTEIIPNTCPTCGAKTEIRVQQTARFLYCTNNNCKAKLIDKLVHFTNRKCLNVEGLSEETIRKFVKLGYLETYVDIFKLKQYKDQIITMLGFGKKSYDNLINSIEKSKDTELYRVIFGLGIDLVGEVSAKELCKHFNNNIDKIINASYNDLLQVKDFGDVTAKNVFNYFADFNNVIEVQELLSYLKIKKEDKKMGNKFEGLTICITGTLSKKRDEYIKIIEDNGGHFINSVSKKTNILLAGTNVGITKLNRAKECGTKIITEDEFNQMIGG